ncbi:hypothetical protein CEXT_754571 [Caerostris extrusa]|uniref:Uncharacterized protein n=1 Tax=Caerostris extrusa TaxID=172846 RepID=A0AAV4NTW5_CAEEX|nr:hypothetical protein CEXT_754571 [Caerostris extrusa]
MVYYSHFHAYIVHYQRISQKFSHILCINNNPFLKISSIHLSINTLSLHIPFPHRHSVLTHCTDLSDPASKASVDDTKPFCGTFQEADPDRLIPSSLSDVLSRTLLAQT